MTQMFQKSNILIFKKKIRDNTYLIKKELIWHIQTAILPIYFYSLMFHSESNSDYFKPFRLSVI